ncbi:MAG: MBL fold metallo-hydrolase [Dehalococcoidia bacterium]|jgi:phosphoribosyl 1,2-cyclic phosphate phosphodiesterase
MKWTILGSGGCAVIPKPLCRCRVCREAREKGAPYARTGPSAFLHDINLLIDTPAEIAGQLNSADIERIDYLTFTHFDPDHSEGLRVVEQIALDFRTWHGYPEKRICLLLPEALKPSLEKVSSQYGPFIDFFLRRGFVELKTYKDKIQLGDIRLTAIPVEHSYQTVFLYVFEQAGAKVVYAPCDIKPFPEHRAEVRHPDLLITQPGIFETGLKHGFEYPAEHPTRRNLYTFEETLKIAERIQAKEVLFMHLEEYWHRSYDDYRALEAEMPGVRFACDGMELTVGTD